MHTPQQQNSEQPKNKRNAHSQGSTLRNELFEIIAKKAENTPIKEWLDEVEAKLLQQREMQGQMQEMQINDACNILELLAENGSPLSFRAIAQGEITLQELLQGKGVYSADALSQRLQSLGSTGEKRDRLIAQHFFKAFQAALPEVYKTKSRDELRSGQALAETIQDLKLFLAKYPQEEKNLKNIKISNQEILNFEVNTPLFKGNKKEFENQTSNQRNPELQQLFNTLLFHQEMGRIRTRIERAEERERELRKILKGELHPAQISLITELTGMSPTAVVSLIELNKAPLGKEFTLPLSKEHLLNGYKTEKALVIDLPQSTLTEKLRQELKILFTTDPSDHKKLIIPLDKIGHLLLLALHLNKAPQNPLQQRYEVQNNSTTAQTEKREEKEETKQEKKTEKAEKENDTLATAATTAATTTEKKPNSTPLTVEKAENPQEAFKKGRIQLKGYRFPQNKESKDIPGLKVGTIIGYKGEKSLLPPTENGNYRDYLRITAIGDTSFEVEAYGGELAHPHYEKQRTQIAINKQQIKTLQEGGAWKLPDPQDPKESGISFLAKLREAGLDKFSQFEDLAWDNKKGFTKEGEQLNACTASSIKNGKKEEYFYQIKYHPATKTYTVSSKDILLGTNTYRREMDLLNFCTFIKEKNLTLETPSDQEAKKQASRAKPTYFNTLQGGRTYLSIDGIKGAIKNLRKKFTTERLDQIKKGQIEAAQEAFMESGLLNFIGKLPLENIGGIVKNMQKERYDKREDRRRGRIEGYLKDFETADFGDIFDQEPPQITSILGTNMKEFAKRDETLQGDDLYKGAALLLAMAKKGKAIYRGIPELKGTGHRVKKLL